MLEGIRSLTPSEFAKFYFDFEPYPFQKKALDCTEKNVQLVWGRQTGKSTTTAVRSIYDALMNDGWTVLVLAPTDRQASRLFKRIKEMIYKSARKFPELKMLEFIDRETQRLFEFTNGSEIIAMPIAEDGKNIVGYTAHKIIVDECGEVKNPACWASINPMTMATGGGKWLIGTLKGTDGLFYQVWKAPEKYGFVTFQATSRENPAADMKQMELDKLIMPISFWKQEYENIAMEEYDSFFPQSLIEKVTDVYDPIECPYPTKDYEYYLGVDVAGEGKDSTVYCILMKTHLNTYKIAKWIETKKQTLPQVDAHIRVLHALWNFKKIMIDVTGGRRIHEALRLDGIPADGFEYSIKSKQDIYQFLKQHMQGGAFTMYENDTAKKQFMDIKYEAAKIGVGYNLKIYSGQSRDHKLPGGDDYVDATVLAMWATKLPMQPILFGSAKGMFARLPA